MSPYFALSALLGFIGWTGLVWYEGHREGSAETQVACQKHDEAQQQVTINAENGVIKTIGQQESVTQKVESAYDKDIVGIEHDYDADWVQPGPAPARSGVRKVPFTSASACSTKTAAFKLSLKECDMEEQKLISLWQWVTQQENVK